METEKLMKNCILVNYYSVPYRQYRHARERRHHIQIGFSVLHKPSIKIANVVICSVRNCKVHSYGCHVKFISAMYRCSPGVSGAALTSIVVMCSEYYVELCVVITHNLMSGATNTINIYNAG